MLLSPPKIACDFRGGPARQKNLSHICSCPPRKSHAIFGGDRLGKKNEGLLNKLRRPVANVQIRRIWTFGLPMNGSAKIFPRGPPLCLGAPFINGGPHAILGGPGELDKSVMVFFFKVPINGYFKKNRSTIFFFSCPPKIP